MKPIVKKIIAIGSFIVVVAAIAVTILLLTKEHPWTPNDYGVRFVAAEEYDPSIQDYEVGKFETYDEFYRSKWANVKYAGDPLKDLYVESYFKNRNLLLIAFNHEYADLTFEVVDCTNTDGRCDISVAAFYDVPKFPREKDEEGYTLVRKYDVIYRTLDPQENYVGTHLVENGKVDTTYCYLFETSEPLANEYTFSIVAEHFNAVASNMYGKNRTETILFTEEDSPVMYRLSSMEEADTFVRGDDRINRMGFFLNILKAVADRSTAENDIILVRFAAPASELSKQGAYLDGTEVVLWELDEAPMFVHGDASYIAMFLVPKEATIESLRWVSYRGEDAPQPRIGENLYRLVKDEGTALEKYNTEKVE